LGQSACPGWAGWHNVPRDTGLFAYRDDAAKITPEVRADLAKAKEKEKKQETKRLA
jgi:hypothetical protein